MWTWKWSPYGQLYNDINKCRTWAMHQQQNNMFHRPAACLPRSTCKRKWSADKRHQILLYFLIRALTHDCCKICRNLWADSIHPSSSFKSAAHGITRLNLCLVSENESLPKSLLCVKPTFCMSDYHLFVWDSI